MFALDSVEVLLRYGANVDKLSRDPSERVETPLFSSCRLGLTSVVRTLIKHGADLDKTDFYSHTPIWINTRDKRVDIINMLIQSGAKLNISACWNQCPLYLACKFSGRLAIATLLIYHGVRVDVIDRNDHSALYWAIENCDRDLIRLLLTAGAWLYKTWVQNETLPLELQQDTSFCDWLRHEAETPPPLQRQCRTLVRDQLRKATDFVSIVSRIEQLPLPNKLKEFTLLKS